MKKNEGGRPTDYREAYNEQARKLTLLGYTNEELADFFKVHLSTIYEWQKVHPKFSDAIKAGKEDADTDVVQSLYKRAKGYEYEETEIKVDEIGAKTMRKTKKYQAPDTAAAFIWLKNRQPKRWRDRREVDHQSSDGSMSPASTKEELKQQLAELGYENKPGQLSQRARPDSDSETT